MVFTFSTPGAALPLISVGNFTSRQQGHFTFITTIVTTASFSLNFAHRDKKALDFYSNGSLLHPFLGLFHST